MVTRSRIRFPLMALSMFALLAALWGGLARLGWRLPLLRPYLLLAHGPLMVSGFLGTLIGVERAVALAAHQRAPEPVSPGVSLVRNWVYAGPLLTGLGALALIIGLPNLPGRLLMTLGSLGLVAVFAVIVGREPVLYTATMALGALAWPAGNGLWLMGWPIYRVVAWWAGFLVLTIAGERLELSRVLRLTQWSQRAFLATTGLFLAGLLVSVVAFDTGVRLAGVGMLAMALWLLRYDIARRTVRQAGLTRFIAVCLLSGYVWLGVSGLLSLLFGGVMAGPLYDAALHTLFLGFVFGMIFGHAPVIFPAVLGRPITFHPIFYAHLALLHLSLALRIVGDLGSWLPGRQWGGLLNVVALLLFLANTARAVRRAA